MIVPCRNGEDRAAGGDTTTGHALLVAVTENLPGSSRLQPAQIPPSARKNKKPAAAPVRAEYLRQYPSGAPFAETALGRRQDAESANSQVDSRFLNRRMPAWSADQAALIMLGFAHLQNSLSRLLHTPTDEQARTAAA